MNIKPECYKCIYNQTFSLLERLKIDDNLASEILRETAKILSKYDLSYSPPDIAKDVYNLISSKTSINDPFKKEKELSIKKALEIKQLININSLYDAVKISLIGNVIDFGVNKDFNLDEEIKAIKNMKFAINDFEKLEEKINSVNSICYLADNAGENVFDEILIEKIKQINKNVKIYYIVRGKPIINDVTFEDVKELDISKLATIINSEVPTPGFSLKYANEKSKQIFYNSDLVISKGMGNFEVLYNECNREVFYLLKAKCNVVANEVNANVGEYIILKADK